VTETIIKTGLARELTVETSWDDIYLRTKETGSFKNVEVSSFLTKEHAVELATALLEAAGKTAVTFDELPEVTEGTRPWADNYLYSNNMAQAADSDPKMVLEKAKGLFAIALELQKRQDEAVAKAKAEFEAEKAKEAELTKRRDKLAFELSEDFYGYAGVNRITQSAIDRIIELEDAAKSQP
jgi:hypothetical protein